jgi:hypothetical protein
VNRSRRRFLFLGVTGVVTLAAARWLQPSMTSARIADGAALSPAGADVMRALVPAFLDGALPAAAEERQAAVERTVAGVATAIAGLPPAARDELATLFSLLALPPMRFLFAGIDGSWRDARTTQAAAFLTRLQKSRWAVKRAAYDALHQLTMAAWYADARTWESIGYPGPPSLS